MKRLSLILSLLALAAATPTVGAAASPTPGCVWKRHARIVVKHLRRHGQPHRVKRVKHWWTCEAQPSVLQPQPALPVAPAATPTPPSEEPAAEVGRLGVKAVEYSYTLSPPELSAGEVIIEFNNQGEDAHNLVLEHEGTEDPKLEIPSTPPASQASAQFVLAPGAYRVYCSLADHAAKGMEATLIVNGS